MPLDRPSSAVTGQDSGSTIRRFDVDAATALDVVGVTVDDVWQAVGRAFDDGEPYLVGSLASGLGNAGSDVDIQVLVPDLPKPVSSKLFFANGVLVDVEQYPAQWATEIALRGADSELARFDFGVLSLCPPLEHRARRWMSRWLHAVPLRESAPPIFSDEQAAAVLPLLVRSAFDQLVISSASARLADAAGASETARHYLWARAGRHLAELRCRAAGDVTTGEKWLSNRARRLGLTVRLPADESEFRVDAAEIGLPAIDEWRIAAVRPAAGARTAELAGRRFLLTRHDQALSTWSRASGPLNLVIASEGAAQVLASLRRAELDLVVDNDAVREALA